MFQMNRISTLLVVLVLIVLTLIVPSTFANSYSSGACGGVSGTSSTTVTASIACPTPVPTEIPPVGAPSDTGRPGELSFNDSDLGVILHQTSDENGNMTLEVYDIFNHSSRGNLLFTVTHEDLAQFVGNLPAENTLLYSIGHVAVYVLTTGEIQMNVGPDSEGKTHVKVFDAIPWTTVYSYVIEPSA
jgi:hypothetical protein